MSMVNCNMFCHMKNGQKWLHTDGGEEVRIEGFGKAAKEDFLEEDVKKLVFSKAANLSDIDVVSVVVDNSLAYGYNNVEEIKFDGVKYAFISKHFPKLRKVTLSQDAISFDLSGLRYSQIEEIVLPKKYWETSVYYSNAKKNTKLKDKDVDKFPSYWSKELKFNLIAHYPFLISALDFVPENRDECEDLYVKVCDEAIRRANERVKTEPKEQVLADEAHNLEMIQKWVVSCNVKNEPIEESLKDVARSNGFGYVPPKYRVK